MKQQKNGTKILWEGKHKQVSGVLGFLTRNTADVRKNNKNPKNKNSQNSNNKTPQAPTKTKNNKTNLKEEICQANGNMNRNCEEK